MNNQNKLIDFEHRTLLNWDDSLKKIIILGQIGPHQAIVILQKRQFQKDVNSYQFLELEEYFQNDIYTKYNFNQQDKVELELIYPATQKHIDKYSQSKLLIVTETFEMYLKNKEKQVSMNLDWVYNILENKAEQQSVVFQNDQFMLLKDYTFTEDNLHLLVLTQDRTIQSLRDLNHQHLPLLIQIQETSIEIMQTQFKLSPESIKLYVHYQPTFYHFHVHITHISIPGEPLRDHGLHTIIQNIKILSTYYQSIDLQYISRQSLQNS